MISWYRLTASFLVLPCTAHPSPLEMANELEELTKDTTIRYAGLRVEARGAFEQAKDLHEVLDEMGKEMRGES